MGTPRADTYSTTQGTAVYGGKAAPSAIPAWLSGKAVNQMFPIAGTTHMGSAADPTDSGDQYSHSTKRLSYCGIATDNGTRIILSAVGGHNDYSGNEVTGIDLAVDAPAWALLNPATPSPVSDVAYQSDGKPSSHHTYNTVHYSSTRSRLIHHYMRGIATGAPSSQASPGFNLASNTWDAPGTWADAPGAGLCRDAHDNVWASSNYFWLWKWDAATDTWTHTNGSFANQVGPTMAHDSTRDQLFELCWGNGQAYGSGVSAFKYDIAGTTQTAITLNSIGGALAQFITDAGSYATMVYDPIVDAFFWWDGNSLHLYKIKPNSTTTWDISIVSTTGVQPPVQSGSFGRMAYIPSLKGLVFMPSGHQPLHFMRTA